MRRLLVDLPHPLGLLLPHQLGLYETVVGGEAGVHLWYDIWLSLYLIYDIVTPDFVS